MEVERGGGVQVFRQTQTPINSPTHPPPKNTSQEMHEKHRILRRGDWYVSKWG